MYEYKFVEVPIPYTFLPKYDKAFKECEDIIIKESKNNWRLKQIISPFHSSNGVYMPTCYKIIFERKLN